MLNYARRRGVVAVCGVGEALPFKSGSFDQVLSVTTICFVNDPLAMLRESHRVLKPGGVFVAGFIDRMSPLGRQYEARKAESLFYRDAVFRSAAEIDSLLVSAGFGPRVWIQNYSKRPETPQRSNSRDRATVRADLSLSGPFGTSFSALIEKYLSLACLGRFAGESRYPWRT
jgi:SAM-dependent methyltransferase